MSLCGVLKARYNSTASGHSEANDLDTPRDDSMIRMSVGKAPFESIGLASQPTMCRVENGATYRDVVRAAIVMIGVYCRTSYKRPLKSVTLDIDNAICPTYGSQEAKNGVPIATRPARRSSTSSTSRRELPSPRFCFRRERLRVPNFFRS